MSLRHNTKATTAVPKLSFQAVTLRVGVGSAGPVRPYKPTLPIFGVDPDASVERYKNTAASSTNRHTQPLQRRQPPTANSLIIQWRTPTVSNCDSKPNNQQRRPAYANSNCVRPTPGPARSSSSPAPITPTIKPKRPMRNNFHVFATTHCLLAARFRAGPLGL